jgi:hypothetical protein
MGQVMQYDQSHRQFLCRDPFAACDYVLYREMCRTVGALSLAREWVWPLGTYGIILPLSNLSTPLNS